MNKIFQIIICLAIGFFIGLLFDDLPISKPPEETTQQIEFYDKIIAEEKAIEIYETTELTEEMLSHRDGKIIIEKVVGKVTNCNLDGKILNCYNKGSYISYKLVDGAKQGDRVLTYFIYNPFTNVHDDVVIRLDFIIDNNII